MAHLQKVVSIDAARKARERGGPRGPQEPPLTKKEIAAHFKVHERTITRWMRDRGMPYSKPFEGGSVRFDCEPCEAWFRGER